MLIASVPEVNKDPAEILIVFFDAVVEFFYLRPNQKAQNVFLQLPTAFTGYDLDKRYPLFDRYAHHPV